MPSTVTITFYYQFALTLLHVCFDAFHYYGTAQGGMLPQLVKHGMLTLVVLRHRREPLLIEKPRGKVVISSYGEHTTREKVGFRRPSCF